MYMIIYMCISYFRCCFYSANDKSVADNTPKYDLSLVTYSNTIPFVPPITRGKVVKVYDGCTITIASQLPYKESPMYRFPIRLSGINTHEIQGGTAEERRSANNARNALYKFIYGKIVILRNCGVEKYGRILSDIYLENTDGVEGADEIHINNWMVTQGYAVVYDAKYCPNEWDGPV